MTTPGKNVGGAGKGGRSKKPAPAFFPSGKKIYKSILAFLKRETLVFINNINKTAGKNVFPSLSWFFGRENLPIGNSFFYNMKECAVPGASFRCPSIVPQDRAAQDIFWGSQAESLFLPSLPPFLIRWIQLSMENRHLQNLYFIKINLFTEMDSLP